jgi:DNA-binding transcriptional LysR family regulator
VSLHDRVSNRLKLRDLRLLLALDEWGSMAKAAAHLHVTQSAVSKAIAELENTFGVRLFDRTPRGIEATSYGRALLSGGVAVFDELRKSVNAIEHLADPTSGELRIGCTEPMAWGIVPRVIDRLVRQHPKLAFHVTQSDPSTLRYHALPERKVELAIGRIAGPLRDETIETEVLYQEKVFIVAGTHSRWAKRRSIDLADLADQPWTLPTPDNFSRLLLEEAFQTRGLPPPRINVVSFSIPLHNALLTGGNFLALLPRSLTHFGANLLSLKILPIELPVRPGPVGIIKLKNRTLTPVTRLFIEHAREVAKPLTSRR